MADEKSLNQPLRTLNTGLSGLERLEIAKSYFLSGENLTIFETHLKTGG